MAAGAMIAPIANKIAAGTMTLRTNGLTYLFFLYSQVCLYFLFGEFSFKENWPIYFPFSYQRIIVFLFSFSSTFEILLPFPNEAESFFREPALSNVLLWSLNPCALVRS